MGAALLVVLFVIAHFDVGGTARNLGTDHDPRSVAWRLLRSIGGWAWAVGIFGAMSPLVRRLPNWASASNFETNGTDVTGGTAAGHMARSTRYASEAIVPFYVLHQTPIVVVGFYVVQRRMSALPKYLTISLLSFVITLLVYEGCVRRTNITRVMFGMRWTSAQPVQPTTFLARQKAY